jgi:hypothetical protein
MAQPLQAGRTAWLIHQICRFTVGGIWLYQGLVPKLLGPHVDELAMSQAFGIPHELGTTVSQIAGISEIAFGVTVIVLHHHAWPQWLSAVMTALLLAFVAIYAPAYLAAAFNPVVMNVASIALSAIALLILSERKPAT